MNCLEQALDKWGRDPNGYGRILYNGDHMDYFPLGVNPPDESYILLPNYGFGHLVRSFKVNADTFMALRSYFYDKHSVKDDMKLSYRDYFLDTTDPNADLAVGYPDKSKQGVKELDNKPIIYTVLKKQFPDAIQEVVRMSMIGHEKYKETDADYLNFKRVADPVETYRNAAIRHLLEIGDGDTQSHAASAAWNCLAALQILLEQK